MKANDTATRVELLRKQRRESAADNGMYDVGINDLDAFAHMQPPTTEYPTLVHLRSAQAICDGLDRHTLALNRAAESNDQMSRRMWWLSLILVIATTISTVATVIQALRN